MVKPSSESDRYTQAQFDAIGPMGVFEHLLQYGTQTQIKIAEKIAIYNYLLYSSHLPPGN